MTLTRREFVEAAARTGGSAAAYRAMTALGLLAPAKPSLPFDLTGTGDGNGVRVLILGAGLAGMCTAYELGKVGYDCRILEARARPGGRCHTIRGGTVEVDTDGVRQVCDFDDGHYLNPGPARIPAHHVTLDYCRAFGVPIEMFGQINESAYYYNENAGPLSGKRVRVREAKADLYGYLDELFAKSIAASDLDKRISADDKEAILEFLREDGGLSPDLTYRPGGRRGYKVFPGASDQVGVSDDPLDLKALLRGGFGGYFAPDYEIDWQMPLFQPVGGMDNIARAFAARLDGKIAYESPVREIRKVGESGVRVVHADKGGKMHTIEADYLVCAIPLAALKSIPADFSEPVQRVINGTGYAPTGKIGLQFKRRFWEEDDRIYGGITRTNLPLTQIFYPSYGWHGKKGVLVGYYHFGPDAVAAGAMAHKQREAMALELGSRIHPQYKTEFETSFSVAWHKTPYSLGGWVNWGRSGSSVDGYALLNRPDGRIYLTGEHLSHLTGWMAGALESARLTARAVHERAAKETKRG